MQPLTITRVRIDLRLHHSARLHFRHEVMLHSLFSEALGKGELPGSVVPFACESGRVDFERDDLYRIGLTVIGADAAQQVEHILRALTLYGARGFQGDGIPMLRWFNVERVETAPPVDLEAECARLAGVPQLLLHWVSPLRMEIPLDPAATTRRRPGSDTPRFFDATTFPPAPFLRLVWNRFFYLAENRHPNRAESESGAPPLPDLACDPHHLLWIDVPRVRKPSLGGVCGRLVLANPGAPWLEYLVAGQYVHTGKSTGYGFGAYRLITEGSLWNDPFGPSRTALERVASHDRLLGAAHRVAAATEGGGTDGMGPAELTRRAEEVATTTARRIADGTYQAGSLLGILANKPTGKIRALAVPTLTDRMVQRAALEVVGPAIETLLEDCSYGYRKGFSRAGAARAIEQAYADGFRYVLDADIDSFFDAVDWNRLFAKLEALYPFEPLMALVRAWVKAPVVFEGMPVTRERGLPQGAVISPLLANLFLDEFDEELLRDDFRLVRYADDFVVLCKDLESAEKAREEARAALQRMGLSLQEEKTSVVSMDHGFTYLGYLFCRSASVDHKRDAVAGPVPLAQQNISPASWLAGVDLSRVRSLQVQGPAPTEPVVVALHGTASAPPSDGRRPLYIFDPAVFLHLRDDTVVIEKEDEPPKRYPLRSLSQVVFIGRPRATLPLILEMGIAGIPVFFCKRNGEMEAVHGPFDPDVGTWLAQARLSGDEAARLAFAQEIVTAKLHNYATITVRHSLRGCDAVAGEIRELERSVWNKTELDSVRGLEGAAAVAYFGAVRETLSSEWGFDGRVKRPPRDPFNAMLSYGYTLLHHHCAASLWAAGLVPRIGLYHREHGEWAALASDLQEEFRYLVDGLVWSMVRRREIRPDEFDRRADGCWLAAGARRRFLESFEQRLETGFRPDGQENALTYRESIGAQAVRLREYILGRGRYEAIRAHA